MTDDNNDPHIKIAKLEERSSNQKDRISKLENNQRYGIVTILGLIAKAAFDALASGAI